MASKLDLYKEQLAFLINVNAPVEKIEEIEEKIKRCKRGKKSRSKGSNYERTLAKKLMDAYPELDLARTPSSGGFKKQASNDIIRGDISNLSKEYEFLLHIEAKNQAKLKLQDWLKQAMDDCPAGKIPTVIFHQGQIIEDGKRVQEAEDYICLPLRDFISIVNKQAIIKKVN